MVLLFMLFFGFLIYLGVSLWQIITTDANPVLKWVCVGAIVLNVVAVVLIACLR